VFLGHFAVGLGAKRAAPALSLGTLFLAVQLADLLWPTLVLLDVERVEVRPGATAVTPLEFVHYPWSHSLMMVLAWGALLGVGVRLARGARTISNATAATVVALTASHWLLDLVTHVPDLPLRPGGALRLGLGLWRSLPATMAVELALFAAGAALYLRATEARDRTGTVALWALLGFLLAVHLASLFGPPPPSADAVAWAGHATWLLVAWGCWVDRHRRPRAAAVA
jgi:hypothetical protein